ncbi:hypothetical protein [Williamsia sp. CHRR-6]|uniref:hypothetical protein n=1 Tax=Williamsia sp. CHRR-6 TaxID=2835871 RepID=UPI001BD97779|nr:hypothetical protein [Williamsia sp. CHRR-6]MBT0567241.1 hypothetical protein [Williamsia sp. CHRR-6]
MTRQHERSRLDRELAAIERSVLDDMHLGRRRLLLAAVDGALVVCLIMAVGSIADSARTDGQMCGLAIAGTAVGSLAALLTAVGVVHPRFRVCWMAAATSAVGTFLLLLGFWSLRTGPAAHLATPLLAATGCTLLVGVAWVGLMLAPLSSSHPDARRAPDTAGPAHPNRSDI